MARCSASASAYGDGSGDSIGASKPFQPSILDFREYFSLNFSILLLLASAIGFAMMAPGGDRRATVRTLSPIYAVAMLLLLGTSVYFSVAQGIVTCPTIAILFGLAWRRSRAEAPAPTSGVTPE